MLRKNKYGVIWAPSQNIGDDFQTLGAIDFLEKHGIDKNDILLINRERLNEYSGEDVNLVMNGWFLTNPNRFPPSQYIHPLFISFHAAKENIVSKNIEYFKKYEPIGCRDTYTVNLFHKYNISAYFTGCLTLGFDNHQAKTDTKYIVDIKTKYKFIPPIDIDMSLFTDFISINHDSKKFRYDPIKRLARSRDILNRYASAKLVITSRLHCVLPCRALNTDCIFIHKNLHTDKRFSGLHDYINGDTQYHTKNTIDSNLISTIKQKLLEIKI